MKNLKFIFLIIIFVFLNSNISNSQSPIKTDTVKYWDFNGNFGITFTQVSFTNWAKGGENSITGLTFANLFANYKKDRWEWDNYLLASYGLAQQGNDNEKIKKNDDRIELNSKIGYKQWNKLLWTFQTNFKTQFAPGYNYPNDTIVVSKFMAPAYLILSLGLDYKPNKYLSLYFSPTTGRFIYVNDTAFSTRYGIERGEKLAPDFGWYFTAAYKNDSIITNVGIATKLSLFQNYTDKNVANRKNIDVDWLGQILFKINSFLSASFDFHLIYDNDIQIPIYKDVNGEKVQIGTGPRTQWMQQIGLGIVYKF